MTGITSRCMTGCAGGFPSTHVLPSRPRNIHNLEEGLLQSRVLTSACPAPESLPTGDRNIGEKSNRRNLSAGSGRVRSEFWTAPNQLTLLRLIFIPFVIMNVLDGEWHWALGLLVAAGLSDALDGWLARALNQRTMLGQYLDPIADKLLLSSLFLVLAFARKIPWKYTVAVLGRDVLIVATCMVLYATVGFRDFRPSIFGKINTVCEIGAVFFVVLAQVIDGPAVRSLGRVFLYATFVFTTISGIHYVLITGYRLRHADPKTPVP